MNRLSAHNQTSLKILSRLNGLGFSPNVQQRLGALMALWSIFESNLERAIWVIQDVDVQGNRPWTDVKPVSEWIKALGAGHKRLPPIANEILKKAASAADNLMHYRHTLLHGFLLPSTDMPSFIRNPAWQGEQRKRLPHIAHVDENLLDMAINSAWTLCQLVLKLREINEDAEVYGQIELLKESVSRADSLAGELRYLTEIMNQEKN